MFRSAAAAVHDAIVAGLKRDPVSSFERELWLWFFAGVVKQRWRDRQTRIAPQPRPQQAKGLQL
jgi:hypothetical protein